MLKILGYILLGLSCLLFLAILIVPWFDLSKARMAGITTVLIIAGEILFYLSLFILGRSFFDKIKAKLKFRKTSKSDNTPNEQTGME
jgi:hypothetical protein